MIYQIKTFCVLMLLQGMYGLTSDKIEMAKPLMQQEAPTVPLRRSSNMSLNNILKGNLVRSEAIILRENHLDLNTSTSTIIGILGDGRTQKSIRLTANGRDIEEFCIIDNPSWLNNEETHLLGIRVNGRFIYVGLSKLDNLFKQCFDYGKFAGMRTKLSNYVGGKKQDPVKLVFPYYDENDDLEK